MDNTNPQKNITDLIMDNKNSKIFIRDNLKKIKNILKKNDSVNIFFWGELVDNSQCFYFQILYSKAFYVKIHNTELAFALLKEILLLSPVVFGNRTKKQDFKKAAAKRTTIRDCNFIRNVYKNIISIAKTSKITGWSSNTVHRIVRDLSSQHPCSLYKDNPILQYDKKGTLIQEYKTPAEASKTTNISESNIVHCLKNNTKTAGTFIFKYK